MCHFSQSLRCEVIKAIEYIRHHALDLYQQKLVPHPVIEEVEDYGPHCFDLGIVKCFLLNDKQLQVHFVAHHDTPTAQRLSNDSYRNVDFALDLFVEGLAYDSCPLQHSMICNTFHEDHWLSR